MNQIAENLLAVRRRLAAACARAKRDPDSVQLMAVSKTLPAPTILHAYAAGERLFGENRVQEFAEKSSTEKSSTEKSSTEKSSTEKSFTERSFAEKSPALRELAGAKWCLIGHLQTNKAQKAVELFDAVDSVDSLRLAEKLNFYAAASGKVLPVLLEINIGGEDAKAGLPPDSPELDALLAAAGGLKNLAFHGLMTVPPFRANPEEVRPYFRQLRELKERIAGRKLPGVFMKELSMGMSHDFEVAIEEGSTCIRVGTAIFGARKAK